MYISFAQKCTAFHQQKVEHFTRKKVFNKKKKLKLIKQKSSFIFCKEVSTNQI